MQHHHPISRLLRIARRQFHLLIAAMPIFAIGVAPLNAADISEGFAVGEVVLEGTINSGDYDKFRDFVENYPIKQLYLASPGGSLTDAIKIGRLVRELKLETIVPADSPDDIREKLGARHKLKNRRNNYMCASACFFVFVAGVKRTADVAAFTSDAVLGIHRPFLTDSDLRALSANQAIATAGQLRSVVETYLREMSVPAKYTDLMFSVSKDNVRWISNADFNTDFEGFVPELRDWIGAKCDTRTDVEKAVWEGVKDKAPARMTAVERSAADMLTKKMAEMDVCESKTLSGLSHEAHLKIFWEPKKAAYCADYHADSYSDAKLAAAVPNEETAATVRDAVQNATLCGDYATRARVIRSLAERGDAGAQLILGSMYYYGTGAQVSRDGISPSKAEGVRWFRRAADQGNREAQGQLSSIYFRGDGVPQNYIDALKWLILGEDDISIRDTYISKMNSEQVAEAKLLASQWRATPERQNRVQSNVRSTMDAAPRWWQFWK